MLGGGGAGDGGAEEDEAAPAKRSEARHAAGDMVVTFGVGLEERLAAKRAQAAGEAEPETVWQAHLRDRKAKRLAAKQSAAAVPEAADAGFDDPFFASAEGAQDWQADEGGDDAPRQRKGKKARRAATGEEAAADQAAASEERRRRAELELLVMDDARLKAGQLATRRPEEAADAGATGKLSRKQARAAAKAAKRAARGGGADEPALDTSDARFAALFTRPEFALDPTDPRIKGTRAADIIRNEARRRAASAAKTHADASAPDDFASVVKKLKRKAGQ